VATNAPIVDRFALHTKMAPYRTYAMAFSIPKGAIPDALYWDTLDPYHYVRLQPGDGRTDFLIVGGGDHKSGEADDAEVRFQALEAWARNLIPAAQGRHPPLVRTRSSTPSITPASSAEIPEAIISMCIPAIPARA
jgi:hypothetical protein